MESKVKLSPAMQAAMWNQAGVRADLMPWALRTKARTYRPATLDALAARKLLTDGTRDLADAGRAWITEQIEAAREDALIYNIARVMYHPANLLAAVRLAAMSGVTFNGVHTVPAIDVERDEIEAYRENDRRDDREGRPYSARLLAADVPYIRYPRVRVSGAELVEAGSVTGAVAIVRRALADEVGAEVARDFADDADNMSWADPAAVLNLIRRWVTVA